MTVSALARAVLALVFLVAGLAKVRDRQGMREAALAFGIPPRLAGPLAAVLPPMELAVGLLLLPAGTARWAAAGAVLLVLAFLLAIGWNLARGRHPECRCFGRLHAAPVGRWALVRNCGLLALALLALALPPTPLAATAGGWLSLLPSSAHLALGLAVVLCGLAAIQAWMLTNLLRQHGRLLLRLDALEARLDGEDNGEVPAAAPRATLRVGLPVGAAAPEFTWPDLNGVAVSLGGLRRTGRPVLLLFVDPACGPCLSLLSRAARWRRELAERVTFAVLSRGTAEANRARLGPYDLAPVLLQADDDTAGRYQTLGTPSAVLVDERGRVASEVLQGAEAIARLIASLRSGSAVLAAHHGRSTSVAVLAGIVVATVLLAGATTDVPAQSRTGPGGVLQVEHGGEWRTWWRGEGAPTEWLRGLEAVMQAVEWRPLAPGAELGELVISGGGLALRTRLILVRFDPRDHVATLVQASAPAGARPAWTIDSASPGAVIAFNGGQFRDDAAWGWLVRDGRELQPPGRGPLSLAVAFPGRGAPRLDSPESLRSRPGVRDGFQSFPALLRDDGRVPPQLLVSDAAVDVRHRDIRLALCTLRDGRVLIALTRFDNLGRIFGGLPIGLTLAEMSATMGALGCDRAVGLDGGVSAQLLVRPSKGPALRWRGWRAVPLGIEVLPRR